MLHSAFATPFPTINRVFLHSYHQHRPSSSFALDPVFFTSFHIPHPIPHHFSHRLPTTTTTTTTITSQQQQQQQPTPPPPPPPPRIPSILTFNTSLVSSLVPLARFSWRTIWTILMSQLAPSDPDGNYLRPMSSMSLLHHPNHNINPNDRLVFFVGYACPWCHRVQLALALAQQQGKWTNVHIVIVQPGDNGLWRFPPSIDDNNIMDMNRMNKMTFLKDVYLHVDPSYSGRFTAPLLYNLTQNKLISNESSQLLNLLLLPSHHDDDLCNTIHTDINDGVYRVGFATSQQAYNLACDRLFQALDKCEALLKQTNGFLCSEHNMSKADVMLFPTVFRFDAVYAPLFRITRRSIGGDYPIMSKWMRRVYHLDDNVKHSCGDLNMIVNHYFASLFPLNASGIVPQTRNIDLSPLP